MSSSRSPVISEQPMFWESQMDVMNTSMCGIGDLTRSSSFRNSFRRSKKEPHWIHSKLLVLRPQMDSCCLLLCVTAVTGHVWLYYGLQQADYSGDGVKWN